MSTAVEKAEDPSRHSKSRGGAPGGKETVWQRYDKLCSGFLPILLNPWVAGFCLLGLILGAALLPKIGMSAPMCTMLLSSGMPCPSCGLTRATTCVLQGEFYGAWQYNPFGFFVAALFFLIGPTSLLPAGQRKKLIRILRPAETAIATIFFVMILGLLIYGFSRMALVKMGDESMEWWVRGGNPPYMVENYGPAPLAQAKGHWFFGGTVKTKGSTISDTNDDENRVLKGSSDE